MWNVERLPAARGTWNEAMWDAVAKIVFSHNSPSKIGQWCKPKPAAKLVLTLVRRSPLMLKERVGGV